MADIKDCKANAQKKRSRKPRSLLHTGSTNSNEAVRICLRTPPDSKQEHAQFQPAFTYPIYGDEETIFGYRGLRIKLDFAADTLKPALNVSWREKFTPVGETKADEVEEKLKEFLPSKTA